METCGEGLAEHAAIPAKMAELLKELADNLDAHVPTIDVRDPAGRAERSAYVDLSSAYAMISDHLAATAERMRGYRGLEPARHREEALADPGLLAHFKKLVAIQKELLDLLRAAVERDREWLGTHGGEG